ncbi:hypothetical protein [Bacillus toyonensis]|uniref:Uncharacterized protein n=1 Tax=Bacillus toyonensis TaxID=155322 RepID=A0AAP8EZY6_9BACI|nr:hypothetical protein [Bacillus toyonensis]PEB94656.1 hypothetical protein CON81_03620 [Bacillus toyonensis]PHE08755.1 hypothetical protein COF62_24240 [Bacillus toyonensis]PHG38445.1 hypothetical protein COI60_05520 [Bacillus toyonensis]HDR6286404.1 hypothetical protein [Bacillus cereus]
MAEEKFQINVSYKDVEQMEKMNPILVRIIENVKAEASRMAEGFKYESASAPGGDSAAGHVKFSLDW